jgi:hypothetical protein
MASSILNSDDGVISGTSGLKSTGGDDGVLVFQSKGTETARINTDKQIVAAAGTASLPIYSTTGDTNTGIFFPAADTIAFTEGGAEAMRIDASGNLGLGVTPSAFGSGSYKALQIGGSTSLMGRAAGSDAYFMSNTFFDQTDYKYVASLAAARYTQTSGEHQWYNAPSGTAGNAISFTQAMTLDASGNLGVGTTSMAPAASRRGMVLRGNSNGAELIVQSTSATDGTNEGMALVAAGTDCFIINRLNGFMAFYTNNTERARIPSGGDFFIGKSVSTFSTAGTILGAGGNGDFTRDSSVLLSLNRLTNDGSLVDFYQATTLEGSISVSGNTITYGAFCGGHWTQLKEGRGYNPDIPRGTVMSSIGEMAVWKSVEWTETIEHPAVEAVESVEAVLDEDGNVIEPAVEAVEGKDAWTESIPHRESYLGNLDIGATFEEDGFTKTVVDDGNERLPKVKISDVVGDKAVYGVFQTWDEVEDMLISSLGAFVVRVAAGVTVEVGDLLESNGDGCAKVQDDDIIRSKTIGKVTSTVATDTYDDGSYTVPCVLYCG